MLQIRNLTGGYTKGHDILQGVNLNVAKGESAGIIGLNGSGKSSLAKAIMNILPYRDGEIIYNGVDITGKSTQKLSEMGVGLFMQGGRVFDELSVRENLSIAAKKTVSNDLFYVGSQKNISKKNINVDEIKKYFLSLRPFDTRFTMTRADKLSGGERHQLALAMCMLRNPSLLILDEPSAGLSPHAADEMYKTLDILRSENDLTIILIEQNVARAVEFCDSISMLKNGVAHRSENKNLKNIEKIMFS
jgi:ABC-type branched-subunit amino acid transport system ATPase component